VGFSAAATERIALATFEGARRVERRGRQLNHSRIFLLVAAGSLKFIAAHRPFAAMFSLFCGSGAVARDAETNNDRGENCMSHFVFLPSEWVVPANETKLSISLTVASRATNFKVEAVI
jgi:hypothetical protein